MIIVFLGASVGPSAATTVSGYAATVAEDLLWAVGGIVLLNAGRFVVDRLVLYRFSTVKEIITDRNVGTGAVECGTYIATALIVAGAIHGEGGGPGTALAFFALGQLALVGFGLFYQAITRYDIHAEIERDNVAAGVAFGASLAAIGVILLRANVGDFVGWGPNLLAFVEYAVLGALALMVLRRLTDWALLPGTTIPLEIARDRNLTAAWIEGVVSTGMAALIFFML